MEEKPLGLTDDGFRSEAAYSYFVTHHALNTRGMFHPGKTNFGYVSDLDNSGRGDWFSVDRYGNVRRHSYYSSGFGRS